MLKSPYKLAIFGATGRLGKLVCLLALKHSSFTLTSALTHANSPHLNCDLGTFLDQLPLGLLISTTPGPTDLFLDVSTASALPEHLALALTHKKPLVIGTTGLLPAHHQLLQEASEHIPIFYSANFSLGMALFHKLAHLLSHSFHPHAEINLVETHHTQKKDAPSGSALSLLKTIQSAKPSASPCVQSIRSGDTVGIHELLFQTPEEEITLSHKAHSRDIFAQGALAAALFLLKEPPGLYGMDDLLSAPQVRVADSG